MEEFVLLEATLSDYNPPVSATNPFRPTERRWLSAVLPTQATAVRQVVGRVQLVVKKPETPMGSETTLPTYWLRFEKVAIRNDRDLPLYVLLSRSNDKVLDGDKSVRQLEASAVTVLLDRGPEGQWKGSHLPEVFEQEVLAFDPLAFASIALCKPATARPPTVVAVVLAYGAFETYVPPTKSAEQLALEMEALSNRLLQTVMEVEEGQLQGDDELSLDALQRNAQQLFRMFDQDKSNSIDFDEYKQMLAYRKLNLLESKAKRFFQLVDDQKKGYIDEREFVVALYITNYLRIQQREQKQRDGGTLATDATQTLSPTDVFHQLDGDRDELLNAFEYEKALELLGVPLDTKQARKKARALFPKVTASISLPQFKSAWVELVDVRFELGKRRIDPSSVTTSDNRLTAPTTGDPEQQQGDTSSLATTIFMKKLTGNMTFQKNHKPTLEQLRRALVAEIDREEHEELCAALRAKEEVVRLEKQRRDAEQEESRRLFQAQRHAATSTRTKEALRERQDKINRKRERVIKDRQARQERQLLHRAEKELEQRTAHEREVVQELMASKIERITRQKARCGDDTVDLSGRALKELPHDLYHGRDALTSLSSLLILDLARNQLQELPSSIFTHLFSLQSLDVSQNELVTLPDELGEARDLQLLDLRSNRLTVLPTTLRNLHELRVLNLAYNRLTRFGDACDGLDALEELNLACNALEVLGDAMGDSLGNLVSLNLRGNASLRRLPNSLQRLRSLSVWDLSACHQKRLGKDVLGAQLQGLRSLNLSYNALTTLPEAVGTLKMLQELNLKGNALATLPTAVSELSQLVTLKAENNALERLPSDCGHVWTALEALQLSHNRLVTLPATFGLMRSLHTLQLDNNRLTALPLELGAVVTLRELDVSWNQLTELPEELGCLEVLATLNLSHNRLTCFPETMAMWQNLTSLRCSHNALTTPLSLALGQLHGLKYLDLALNQLSALEPCLYELPALEVLNLAGNHITLLPREMAQHCTALRKLDLHSNRLRALPLELADGLLAQLEVLSIGRNPLERLPEKHSSAWKLKDQYLTSFANGYTSAEAKAWVLDQRVCYPVIVRIWEELTAMASRTPECDAKLSSDDFCQRVRAAMGRANSGEKLGAWLPRYEQIARYFFYEFKHLGHAIVLDASTERQRAEQHAEAEVRVRARRLERADRAVKESDASRARVDEVYRVDRTELATSIADAYHQKRVEHSQRLLEKAHHEAQALNAILAEKMPSAQHTHEEAERRRRVEFAEEMKRLARERLQNKQQQQRRGSVLQGVSGTRKVFAVADKQSEVGGSLAVAAPPGSCDDDER